MLGLAPSKHPRLGGNNMPNCLFVLTGCIATLLSPYRAKAFEGCTGIPCLLTLRIWPVFFSTFFLFFFIFCFGKGGGQSNVHERSRCISNYNCIHHHIVIFHSHHHLSLKICVLGWLLFFSFFNVFANIDVFKIWIIKSNSFYPS